MVDWKQLRLCWWMRIWYDGELWGICVLCVYVRYSLACGLVLPPYFDACFALNTKVHSHSLSYSILYITYLCCLFSWFVDSSTWDTQIWVFLCCCWNIVIVRTYRTLSRPRCFGSIIRRSQCCCSVPVTLISSSLMTGLAQSFNRLTGTPWASKLKVAHSACSCKSRLMPSIW